MAYPRVELLNTDGAVYVGYGKRMHAELERQRLRLGVPVLSRVFLVDGFTITIVSSAPRDLVRIDGASPVWQILLYNAQHTVGYNYLRDAVKTLFSGDSAGNKYGPDGSDFVTYVVAPNLVFSADAAGVYAGRPFVVPQTVASIDTGVALLPGYRGLSSSLVLVNLYETQAPWNLYQGALGFTVNPLNGDVTESWQWLPSFFVAHPTDTFALKPGWYYGKYPAADYSLDDPLQSATVTLVAVADNRNAGGTDGWCEVVTEVNGDAVCDVNIYLGQMSVAGNAYAYRELALGSRNSAQITIGSDLLGFDRAAQIKGEILGSVPDVALWSYTATNGETTEEAFGVVVVESTTCRIYRYAGFLSLVATIDDYYSHAVSDNGATLAVFTSAGALIEGVQVFDMAGERVVKLSEPAAYQGFTPTLVRTSSKPRPALAEQGYFFRAYNSKPTGYAFGAQQAIAATLTPEMSALATLSFPRDGIGALKINKLVVTAGVTATYTAAVDTCFESTVVIADPDIYSDTDHLVAQWDAGGAFRGLVRGSFSGAGQAIRFDGEGIGVEITLPKTLSIGRSEAAGVYVVGAVGDITYSGCFNADGTENLDCSPNCDGVKTFSASTSCGQTGEFLDYTGVPALVLSGTETPVVTSVYSASGGVPPYTYSISSGSINSETGEVTDLTGVCGSGTVTVTDACSTTANLTVRFPVGVWNYTGTDLWGDPCSRAAFVNMTCTSYSGSQRTDYSWNHLVQVFPQQIGCFGCFSGSNVLTEHPCTGDPLPYACTTGGTDQAHIKVHAYVYEWICP